MSTPHTELKEATKLVLYGWGYPTLFSQPNGDRFQNRIVSFPPNASPQIAGASQESLSQVLAKLKLVRSRYRNLFKQQPSDLNPIWVWVDAPQQLTEVDILNYRQQFEYWVENTQANATLIDRFLNLDSLMSFTTKGLLTNWKQRAYVVVILLVITLMMIQVR